MITKKINWLIEKPIGKTLKRTLLFGIILLVVTAPVIIQMLESTNFPGTLDETQLGFNGEYIRECFSTMTEKDISNFILANIVDYFFMISYAAMLTSMSLLLTRRLNDPRLRKIGLIISLLGTVAALSDAAENIFIISMATNPLHFPAWLAIPHSLFAHIKFNLMYITAGWIGIATLLLLSKWIQQKIASKFIIDEKVTVI